MKSRAPQLHLEYRFYKALGNAGKSCSNSQSSLKLIVVIRKVCLWRTGSCKIQSSSLYFFFSTAR